MVKLDLEQILETTDTIVQELLATGEFGHCTFKDVLTRVDARLEFPRGTLTQYEHKNTVKERIKVLLLQAEEAGGPTPSPPKKRTAAPRPKAGVRPNKRSRGDTAASDQDGSDTEPKSKNAKKSRPTSKLKAKETKVDKAPRKKSGSKSKDSRNKPAISAETVDSDLDPGPSTSTPSPKKAPKQKVAESSDEDGADSLQAKSQHSLKRPKAEPTPEMRDVSGSKSESELSVLLDDEPPKRRRKAKDEKTEAKPKGTQKKKEKKELPRDEETIKRLKSLVVACGVRKVWSKEFKGLDSPSAQIKRLKSILTELGMSGRMSLEQAKAIKMKREFAQELEDIQDFEKKVVGRHEGRSSREKPGATKGGESSDEEENDEDDGDDSDESKPRKKRINARNSINAFLEDQSDED